MHGPVAVFNMGAASGASISSVLDIGTRKYDNMAIGYTTMSTGAEVTLYGSDSSTGTFKAIAVQEPGTAAAAHSCVVACPM